MDRQFSESVSHRSGSGSRTSTNRDRMRYCRCRECDHFAEDCTNMKMADSDQPEQMQLLGSTEEEDSSLQLFAGETYNSLTRLVQRK